MAKLARSSSGPLVKIKVSPLNVRRTSCSQVLMRSMRGPQAGRWEAISTSGFVVVCPSKLESSELVWLIGGRHFPRPAALIHDDDRDDFRYLDWLLANYFRIDPLHEAEVGPFDGEGVCSRRMQVMFATFLKGWYPDMADVVTATTAAESLIVPALRHRWSGR